MKCNSKWYERSGSCCARRWRRARTWRVPNVRCHQFSEARSFRDFSRIDLVHVTPDPALAGLDGAHQRMRCAMKVFGGVLVLRGIAASHMAAFQAESKMHPSVADLDAVFADMQLGVRDFDLIEMCAACGHIAPVCRVSVPVISGPNCRTPPRLRRCSEEIPSTRLSENQPFARRHTSEEILSSADGRRLPLGRCVAPQNRLAPGPHRSRR